MCPILNHLMYFAFTPNRCSKRGNEQNSTPTVKKKTELLQQPFGITSFYLGFHEVRLYS